MPLIAAAIALLFVLVLITLIVPLSIIQRYRMGTARRRARRWIATVNVFSIGLSATLFLITAAVTNTWIPRAFVYSLGGLATGCVLGLLGLATTRWEITPDTIHFTPNRWLVLSITLVVTARIAYGFWRAWQTWRATADETSLIAAFGVAGSMAAGAVVIGYYLMYWAGVRKRMTSHLAVIAQPRPRYQKD